MRMYGLLLSSAAWAAAIAPASAQVSASAAPATAAGAEAPVTNSGGSPNQAQAPSEATAQLGDVVVTAERRSTNVQKTALAITALAGDELARAGVSSAASLVSAVPGLGVNTNTPLQNVFIRGVGGGVVNNYGDPAVAYNVDGVYVQRPFGGPSGTYFDLNRVEVIKGPQGTLYGRNATVGALNVITNAPVFRNEGSVSAEVGNYGDLQTSGAANFMLSDTVATRFAFKQNRHDGYTTNGYNDAKSIAGRASILFKPDSTFSLRLTSDIFHDGSRGPQTIFIYQQNNTQKFTDPDNPWFGTQTPPCAVSIRCPVLPTTFLSANAPPLSGRDSFTDNTVWSVKAELNYDIGGAMITVIPAYINSDINYRYYSGGFVGDADYLSRQYSLESRITSTGEGRLKWVAGLFYYAERQNALSDFYQPQGYVVIDIPHQKDTSYAAFGQATFSLTGRLRATGGIRYTHEKKSQDGYSQIANVPPPTCLAAGATLVPGPEVPPRCQVPNAGSTRESNVSWKAGVEYDLAERSLLYGNVSTGFKAGGLHIGLAPNTYKPERITAFQLGSKNRFFNNRVQLNLEAFYWRYRDQQVYTFANVQPAGFSSYPINADGWLRGIEANLVLLPTRNDRFTFDAVYETGKFTRYDSPAATLFVPPVTTITIVPAVSLRNVERPAIPKMNGSATYQHTFALQNGGSVMLDAGTHFETAAWFDLTHRPNSYRGAYAMEDMKLTYNSPDDRWSISAFVNNVTNAAVIYGGTSLTYTKSSAYVPPNADAWTVSIYPPRTYGVRFNLKF